MKKKHLYEGRNSFNNNRNVHADNKPNCKMVLHDKFGYQTKTDSKNRPKMACLHKAPTNLRTKSDFAASIVLKFVMSMSKFANFVVIIRCNAYSSQSR